MDLPGILPGKPLVAAVAAGKGLFDGLVLLVGTVTLLVTALTEKVVVISLVVLILMGVVAAIASVNKIYM